MGKQRTPAQDPLIGQAAATNAQIGGRLADLSEREYADAKALTDRFTPIYEQILQSQLDSSALDTERSASQWDQYSSIFQPIENEFAQKARDYASPEEVARREGLAAATVGKQFDAAAGQTERELGRMGASPTSSLGLQALTDQGNARALATAGAVNAERNNTELMGLQTLQSAAQFGRNQTQTGLAASAAALNGNNAALGTMGAHTAQAGAAGQAAGGLLGQAVGANQAAGNLALNAWQGQANAASQSNAGLGSLIGTGIMAGAKYGPSLLGAASKVGSLFAMSSEDVKEGKVPVDDEAALAGLREVPVESWKYKAGVGDEGRHTGPYAQDMQRAFGDDVAPGGVGLDLISVSGTHHAAIRALDKKVDRLASELGLAQIKPARSTRRAARAAGDDGALPPQLRGDMTPPLLGLEAI